SDEIRSMLNSKYDRESLSEILGIDKDKQSNKDKSGQNKKSGNNVGSTLGIIAAIAAVLGLVGGGIFWAIQQNLIPNIQLPNIPGLPTNIPNPFAPPAPAPAPAPTSSAAPAPAE
ncbi:MAG: hypothetical protein ACFNPV_09290, partial [Corynebacterium matruchotii]